MKRLAICLCFIVGMMVGGGIFAQDNDTIVVQSTEKPLPVNGAEGNVMSKWKNSIDPFVGVWTLEKTILDADGENMDVCSGTFMIIDSDASYTIFVWYDGGTYITSQGVILVDSSYEFIEVISHHMNKSLIGVSNRVDYRLDSNYLHKSFWIGKDKYGNDYNDQIEETWKRAKMPVVGDYRNNPAFPI